MISNIEETKNSHDKFKVIGVGCAGGNVVKRMVETGLTNIEYYVVNTDQRVNNKVNYATPVLIGSNITQGFGCAGYPVRGRLAAEEDSDKLHQIMHDADIVLVIAGMGGGTGTGAVPVIASLSREQGAFTVGIVTLPFNFEGERCVEIAELGLQKLRENADSVLVVPNQRIHDTVESKLTISDAYGLSDEMLIRCVETIYEFHSSIRRKDIEL
ncbi:MAG: hypothetical protein OXD54_15160 [Candidatus Poribacteria bacterium]|nr:hypothetical protein [Candidatus Poribacteria bacterium]